jgi:protein-S-isoprenylcysteine O-methyltransferase Ste14
MDDNTDTAGVIAFPPLIYGVPLGATLLLDRLLLKRPLAPVSQLLSAGFFIGALALFSSASAEFKKAGTAIDPFEATTALVESGPYTQTRNPLYLGLTFTYAGIALAARSGLSLAAIPIVLWVMSVGVIAREERYLERKFGDGYRSYAKRVPRWL